MKYHNRTSEKNTLVKDLSEHFDQISSDQVLAELRVLLEQDAICTRNYTGDHPLVDHYLELLSVQELR